MSLNVMPELHYLLSKAEMRMLEVERDIVDDLNKFVNGRHLCEGVPCVEHLDGRYWCLNRQRHCLGFLASHLAYVLS